MLRRLVNSVRMLRPRNIADVSRLAVESKRTMRRMGSDVRDLQRALSSNQKRHADEVLRLERRLAAVQDGCRAEIEELKAHVHTLSHELSQVRLQEAQLRAVVRRDMELERQLPRLTAILDDASTSRHVRDRLAGAPLSLHPFPYLVVDDLLPAPVYDALIEGLPPVELFADRPVNKRQLGVPFAFGPAYSRRVWSYVANQIAPRMITPTALERFREPLRTWLGATLAPNALAMLDAMEMGCTDGRILLRGPGYRIPPHRDPKWGFITCLMYLAKAGDDRSLGTELYSVDDDGEADNAKPHYMPADRCRLETTIEFHPNRALLFLNSAGAHGASIPADAPASLERYLYQFRIGPGRRQIRALLDSLPEARRAAWEGKLADY